LLADLRLIFGEAEAMSTNAILSALNALDEAPWGDLRGKPLDARRLARLLRPYDVRPADVRVPVPGQPVALASATDSPPSATSATEHVLKGYKREDLHDQWERYLPPPDAAEEPPAGVDPPAADEVGGEGAWEF
jgi:hypothetical protein